MVRVQLSLIVTDKTLDSELIQPYKAVKGALPELVCKLLSAYYYNQEVRRLVDGADLEQPENDLQSIIDNMRSTLAIQSFMADELQNSVEESASNIENIVNRTNDMATNAGFYDENMNPVSTTLKALTGGSQPKQAESKKTAETMSADNETLVLAKVLKKLLIKNGITEDIGVLDAILGGSNTSQEADTPKTSSSEYKTQGGFTPTEVEEDLGTSESAVFEKPAEIEQPIQAQPVAETPVQVVAPVEPAPAEVIEEQPAEEEDNEFAMNALNNLLRSAGMG